MKISKESHRKTGVGIQGNEPEGLLYSYPAKRDEQIKYIVNKRADSTKVLFNLFGTGDGVKGISENAKDVANIVNESIRRLKGNKYNNEQIKKGLKVDTVITEINKLSKNKDYNEIKFQKDAVNEALDRLLKKSFRRGATKNAIGNLLISTLVDKSILSKKEKADIQENFIEQLVEEYDKNIVKDYTYNAIKNQNMVIQPSKERQVLVIAETTKSKEKKTSEKDAFRQFLSDYATLDESDRHNLRIRLRRLVDLYFYGENGFIKDDFDEWKEHENKKSKEEFFVKPVRKQNDGQETKTLNVDATADVIREKNMECYKDSLKYANKNLVLFFDKEVLNKFWIHHIENEVERVYAHLKKNTGDYKFQIGYLSEKVWKGIINYLSIKYIAEGKAVYNYAMKALADDSKIFGKLDERYTNGISSFEYERIKAEETLQRECAVNVAFATNHLSNATVVLDEENTDFLLLKHTKDNRTLDECAEKKPNTRRNILQFFGGESSWSDFDFRGYDDIKLLNDLREILYSLRNASFHFKTENEKSNWNQELIGEMFAYECQKASIVQKNKYYSNNVLMFYSQGDIKKLLEKLYSNYAKRASQVPSFNAVFVRKNFPEYLAEQDINLKMSREDSLKWQSAVYYIYKEIYYNGFLQDKSAFKLLEDYVNALPTNMKDRKERKTKEASAHEDFQRAFRLYGTTKDLSKTCQQIMTEYNNQNKGHRVSISGRTNKGQELIFQHYKMILFAGLRAAFIQYVKNNKDVFDFISNPVLVEKVPPIEEFLPDYSTKQYDGLIELVKKQADLQKWYIAGRLLNPKQVNQLIGSFRSYDQYVGDVSRRAKRTNNSLKNSKISIDVGNVIEVLDICTKLNGATSNVLEDYFDDADDYAAYVGKFVDCKQGINKLTDVQLGNFCNKDIGGEKIGIYHDGTNPILNRNIIQCKLYGATDIISNCIYEAKMLPVDYEIIKNYKESTESIKEYQLSGTLKEIEDQKKIRKYQELKNRVELRNLVEYSEIINELQGQLVNWGYLRERDLMYFQLGFHYLCLNNDSQKPDGYDKAGDYVGAILYQIVAMYTNGLSLIDSTGKSKKNGKASAGAKIGSFVSYSEEICGDKEAIYTAGLELFENINEHQQCVYLRNYIEHFHYYAKQDRNMLDIYSEVFDRFFTYDMKYTKNVPNMMYNILLQHLVVPTFEFGTREKMLDDKKTKKRAFFTLKETNGLASEKFTYKIGEKKKDVKLCARGNDYLNDVAALLYYPDKAPNTVIKDTVKEDSVVNKKQPNQ